MARRSGGTQLWVRDAGALEPRPLPGTEGANFPAISPRGDQVAFIVGSALRVVPLGGGAVTTVTDTLRTFVPIRWADDDHVLLPTHGITRIPVRGGAWQRITTVDTARSEVFHTAPAALRGGRTLFVVVPRNSGDNSLFTVAVSDPATGRHRTLMPGFWASYVDPGYLLVVRPDRSLVALRFDAQRAQTTGTPVILSPSVTILSNGYPQVAVAPTGQLVFATGVPGEAWVSLARVRRDGKPVLLDSTWAGDVGGVATSRTGTHVAAAVDLGSRDIQVWNLRTGAPTRITAPGLLTDHPVFSPDGQAVYFATGSPAGGTIRAAALGSSTEPRVVLRDTAQLFAESALAPDGRTLYYAWGKGGRWDIRAHVLGDGGGEDRAVVATPAQERSPAPSPDGRWLAYVSDESGRREVYVCSTDPGRTERWLVSTGGGSTPRWSRDGRELLYFGRDSLMTARVAGGDEFAVVVRQALFALAPFSTESAAFDVLPASDGFVMLLKRGAAVAGGQLVFVDQWPALLTASRGRL